MTESLGDRMKNNYENRASLMLTRRMPVIIRLDGKAFHTLTKQCDKPFDEKLSDAMVETAFYLCEKIQGAKCAYTQSDEISVLLTDFDTLTTQGWFDYNQQKMVAVSAGVASVRFSELFGSYGIFDSRAFNIPKEEVANYFVWRQKDWIRNSVLMLSQSHFSHNQLHGKGQAEMHEMLHEKSVFWNGLSERWKNGTFIHKESEGWILSGDIIFTQNRGAVEKYLGQKETT